MEIRKFQRLSRRTLPAGTKQKDLVSNMTLGLVGESGEIVDIIKKHLYQGHDIDKAHLIEEIGDTMFYIANLCNILDIELHDALSQNVAKLEKRYPDGFEISKSVNR